MGIEYGDTFTVFSKKPEKEKEFYKRVEEAKEELKKKGHITFFMKKWLLWNISSRKGNTLLKYKDMVIDKDRSSGRPMYKAFYVKVERGQCRTTNPEWVAFLDMKDGFVREENRELPPLEKSRYELSETRKEKEKLEAEITELKEKMEGQKKVKNASIKGKAKGQKKDI